MTANPNTALVVKRAFRGFRLARRRRDRAACGGGSGGDGDLPVLRRARRERQAWRRRASPWSGVKSERRKEAEAAAEKLGVADIQFWDLGDYPLNLTQDALFRLVDVYRAIHPAFVLSHSEKDIYNHDHPATTDFAQHARIHRAAHRTLNPNEKVLGAPPVFLFDRTSPSSATGSRTSCSTSPPVWDKKRAASRVHGGPEHLWEYYTRVALQARRQPRHAIRQEDHLWRGLSGRCFRMSWSDGMSVVITGTRESPRNSSRIRAFRRRDGHEAQGRTGCSPRNMRPSIPRPARRLASHCFRSSGVQVDAYMFRGRECRAGNVLVVAPTSPSDAGYFGNCSRNFASRARRRRADHGSGRART